MSRKESRRMTHDHYANRALDRVLSITDNQLSEVLRVNMTCLSARHIRYLFANRKDEMLKPFVAAAFLYAANDSYLGLFMKHLNTLETPDLLAYLNIRLENFVAWGDKTLFEIAYSASYSHYVKMKRLIESKVLPTEAIDQLFSSFSLYQYAKESYSGRALFPVLHCSETWLVKKLEELAKALQSDGLSDEMAITPHQYVLNWLQAISHSYDIMAAKARIESLMAPTAGTSTAATVTAAGAIAVHGIMRVAAESKGVDQAEDHEQELMVKHHSHA